MRCVGVTGTNGKTSTVGFLRALAEAQGRRAVAIGTLGMTGRSGRAPRSAWELDDLRRRLEGEGVDLFVVELFASNLATQAYLPDWLDAGIVTGLGRDHLDRFGDIAAYHAAKAEMLPLLKADAPLVLPAGLPATERFGVRARAQGTPVVSVGEPFRILAPGPVLDGGTPPHARLEARDGEFRSPVIGRTFLGNLALAARTLALLDGHEPGRDVLGAAVLPPGRLEWLGSVGGADIFVDYAHTPCALSAVLADLGATGRPVRLAFGCGGERDRGKRPEMGHVAARLAASVIVTDDNPRDEDPAGIRAEILATCPEAVEVPGRAVAVARLLGEAGPGDVLLLAGRGHEAGADCPADADLVRAALAARGQSSASASPIAASRRLFSP